MPKRVARIADIVVTTGGAGVLGEARSSKNTFPVRLPPRPAGALELSLSPEIHPHSARVCQIIHGLVRIIARAGVAIATICRSESRILDNVRFGSS